MSAISEWNSDEVPPAGAVVYFLAADGLGACGGAEGHHAPIVACSGALFAFRPFGERSARAARPPRPRARAVVGPFYLRELGA